MNSATTNENSSSSVLLERLSFDQTISRVFSIYCKGFTVFSKLGLILLILPIVLTAFVIQPALLDWYGLDEEAYKTDPNYILAHLGDVMLLSFLKAAVAIPFTWLFALSSIHVVGTLYMGRSLNATESLKVAVKMACPFFLAMLLAMTITYLGYALFIVPGVYISVRFFVVAPAMVIENVGITDSLKRSFALVNNSWCYVFCIYFVVILITVPGQMIWNLVMQVLFGDPNFSSLGCFASLLWLVVLSPLCAICQTVMYFNLRVEKEGLNADVLWNEFGRGGSSSGGDGHPGYDTLLADEEEIVLEASPTTEVL